MVFGSDYEAEQKESMFGYENPTQTDYHAINHDLRETPSGGTQNSKKR